MMATITDRGQGDVKKTRIRGKSGPPTGFLSRSPQRQALAIGKLNGRNFLKSQRLSSVPSPRGPIAKRHPPSLARYTSFFTYSFSTPQHSSIGILSLGLWLQFPSCHKDRKRLHRLANQNRSLGKRLGCKRDRHRSHPEMDRIASANAHFSQSCMLRQHQVCIRHLSPKTPFNSALQLNARFVTDLPVNNDASQKRSLPSTCKSGYKTNLVLIREPILEQ